MSEWLSLMNVGDVHFYERNGSSEKSVSDSHGCVSVGASIYDNETNTLGFGLMNSVDNKSFCITLVGEQLCFVVLGGLDSGFFFDVSQGSGSVFFGLTSTEKVQIWTIDK